MKYYNKKMGDIENLILVDASFTSFYRFFATIRWYSFAKKEEFKKIKDNPEYDFTKDELFMNTYSKMYMKGVEDIMGKKAMEKSVVIFCQDAPQSTLWRHKLVQSSDFKEQYKGERADLSKKYNFDKVFSYTYKTLIPKIKKENKDRYPVFQIKLPQTEADDIIAIITLELEKKLPSHKIVIVSGDDDFTQLGRENVGIMNYRKKKIEYYNKKDTMEKLKLKIIMGDKSDNILSIFPKSRKEVSLKDRKAIKENSKVLETFLNNNSSMKQRYKLNEKLIDFRKIPGNIKKPILKEFKEILKKL